MKHTIIIALASILMVSCASFQPIPNETKLRAIQIGIQELDLDINVHLMELKRNYEPTIKGGFVVEGRMSGRNGEYKMQMSKDISTSSLSRIVAHELIHAQQFESGDLRIIDAKRMYWRGKIIRSWQGQSHSYRPWETDANKRGRKLAYIIKLKLKD
tara:strand:- start:46293 stop:46763 length:471 start_codon:yes stop_codon:yes gene_type:complete